MAGAGDALKSFFTHPATIGAGIGSLGGAGIGYLAADDPEQRLRGALVGAGMGAGLGGMTGALAVPPVVERRVNVDPHRLRKLVQDAGRLGSIRGQKRLIKNMPTGLPITDEVKAALLEQLERMG